MSRKIVIFATLKQPSIYFKITESTQMEKTANAELITFRYQNFGQRIAPLLYATTPTSVGLTLVHCLFLEELMVLEDATLQYALRCKKQKFVEGRPQFDVSAARKYVEKWSQTYGLHTLTEEQQKDKKLLFKSKAFLQTQFQNIEEVVRLMRTAKFDMDVWKVACLIVMSLIKVDINLIPAMQEDYSPENMEKIYNGHAGSYALRLKSNDDDDLSRLFKKFVNIKRRDAQEREATKFLDERWTVFKASGFFDLGVNASDQDYRDELDALMTEAGGICPEPTAVGQYLYDKSEWLESDSILAFYSYVYIRQKIEEWRHPVVQAEAEPETPVNGCESIVTPGVDIEKLKACVKEIDSLIIDGEFSKYACLFKVLLDHHLLRGDDRNVLGFSQLLRFWGFGIGRTEDLLRQSISKKKQKMYNDQRKGDSFPRFKEWRTDKIKPYYKVCTAISKSLENHGFLYPES